MRTFPALALLLSASSRSDYPSLLKPRLHSDRIEIPFLHSSGLSAPSLFFIELLHKCNDFIFFILFVSNGHIILVYKEEY